MRTQRFGIEIEMTGITRAAAASVIAGYFGTSSRHAGSHYDIFEAADRQGRISKCMSDSSIACERKAAGGKREPAGWEYSTEVVSPVLGYEDIGDLQEVIRQLRHSG